MFNSPGGGVPWDDLREIFSGCQWMAKVPNAVQILPKLNRLSRAHERYRRQTTDRQTTDGRAIAYSEREREFTFAKNLNSVSQSINSYYNILKKWHLRRVEYIEETSQ